MVYYPWNQAWKVLACRKMMHMFGTNIRKISGERANLCLPGKWPSKCCVVAVHTCELNIAHLGSVFQNIISTDLWTQIHLWPKLGEIPFTGLQDMVFTRLLLLVMTGEARTVPLHSVWCCDLTKHMPLIKHNAINVLQCKISSGHSTAERDIRHKRIRSHLPCRTADRFHDCSNRKQTDAPRRYSCMEFGGSSWNDNIKDNADTFNLPVELVEYIRMYNTWNMIIICC